MLSYPIPAILRFSISFQASHPVLLSWTRLAQKSETMTIIKICWGCRLGVFDRPLFWGHSANAEVWAIVLYIKSAQQNGQSSCILRKVKSLSLNAVGSHLISSILVMLKWAVEWPGLGYSLGYGFALFGPRNVELGLCWEERNHIRKSKKIAPQFSSCPKSAANVYRAQS